MWSHFEDQIVINVCAHLLVVTLVHLFVHSVALDDAALDQVDVTSLLDEEDLVVGKKLDGHTFYTMFDVSVTQCWKECYSRPKCFSINYIRRLKLCELNHIPNSDLSARHQLVNDAGYVFAEVNVSIYHNITICLRFQVK